MIGSTRNQISALQQENDQLRSEIELLRIEVNSLHNAFASLLNVIKTAETAAEIEDDELFQILDWIIKGALSSIEADDGSILLVDEGANEFLFAVVAGSVHYELIGHRIPLSTGIAGWVFANRAPLLVPHASLDPRFSPDTDRQFGFRTESMVCVPMIYQQKVIGVIQALNKQHGKSFGTADLTLIQVVAYLAAEAIHRIENRMNVGT